MDPRIVILIDCVASRPVEATLHLALSADRIRSVESVWAPLRIALRAQHSHWDWDYKSGLLAEPGVLCMGVECAGQMQGLMLTRESGYVARLDPDGGQPLVYVDYVEAAPWNIPTATRRYAGVGQVLLQEAIRRSVQLGYGGRLGLHSLPQVESFYTQKCGMVCCGKDPGYHGLMYFEFTAARGTAFAEA